MQNIVGDFVKWLISNKKIIFSDEDIDEFLLQKGVEEEIEPQSILEKLNYIILLDSPDNSVYLILPKNIPITYLVPTESEILSVIYRFFEERNKEENAEKLIARIIYELHSSALEFAYEDDDYLAWYLYKLYETYPVKPDEVVDRFSDETYTGDVFYRFGKIWIKTHYFYANYNRYGDYVGTQKGIAFSFEEPQ